MIASVEEINIVECHAKFVALKELLEDDIEESSPSQSEFINVSANHPVFKDLYLQLRVAQQKYKNKFVPNQITEAEFNAPGNHSTMMMSGL